VELVSVVIPCFNVETYIEECLDSVLKQSYSEIEIICIDNNSEDGTLEKLNKFKDRFPDKIVIDFETKKGAAAARNKGLSLVRGNWIQFLDADDLLMPNKIEHQVSLIEKNIDVIYGASYKRNLSGSEELMPINKNILLGLLSTQLGNTCSNLFKKEKLIKVGGWNTGLISSQEYDLMIRLYKMNAIFKIDAKPLTIVREREFGQISSNKYKWKTYLKIRLEFLNFLELKGVEIKNEYLHVIFNVVINCAIHNKLYVLFIMIKKIKLFLKMRYKIFLRIIYNILFVYN